MPRIKRWMNGGLIGLVKYNKNDGAAVRKELVYLASSAGWWLSSRLGINHQNMRSSDIVTTCPQKRQKSNALIAITRSIAHSMSAFHAYIPSTNRKLYSPWLLGATALFIEQVQVQVRSFRIPRLLLRKSGSGDSDVDDHDHIKDL